MEQRKIDIQELVDSVLPLAKLLLVKQGEFLPYGFAMNTNGEIISISAQNHEEHPSPNDLASILRKSFQVSASEKIYKATALAYDVKLSKTDAIAIDLDYITGYSVTLLIPYTKNNDEYLYEGIKMQKGKNLIFK